jgi:hypothetical protein
MEIFLEVTVTQLRAVFLLIQNDSIMPSTVFVKCTHYKYFADKN